MQAFFAVPDPVSDRLVLESFPTPLPLYEKRQSWGA